MVIIKIPTSDSIVWKRDAVLLEFIQATQSKQPIVLDFMAEGPDINCLDILDTLVEICRIHQYPLELITVYTDNIVQDSLPFNLEVLAPWQFISNTRNHTQSSNKTFDHTFKTFGILIGRSNQHRLKLSSYLWKHYPHLTLQTFHYDPGNDFHRNNIGINELINNPDNKDIIEVAEFLINCPIKGSDNPSYPILMNNHCNVSVEYANFFVEIVCESYFTGNTFFPTEKTWRAIANRTPFIVQGPQYYLHRLRDLGFKTFGDFWDEGYAEDPASWQPSEIIRIIDHLSTLTTLQLNTMYDSMKQILDYNYNRFFDLTPKDFENVRK